MPVAYLDEFRSHWRSLVAACVGVGVGAALNFFTMSTFGPALIADLGWSKADFALVGSLPLATMLLMPFAGRFTDRFGPRIAATIGFIVVPLGFLGMSMMSGKLIEFFALNIFLNTFGVLTSAFVFCRIVVERFNTARGAALSLVMCASPLAAAVAAPLLGAIIAHSGWRAAYVALALISGVGGLLAILMMGNGRSGAAPPREKSKLSQAEFLGLVRNPVFLLMIGGMFLVNVPMVFATSQLKLIVMDLGVNDQFATWLISVYAGGVIIGRCVSGLALDRIEAHIVALATLSLPAVGFCLLAAQLTTVPILLLAVLSVGFAHGAESDIGAFLISRRFDLKNFSLLLSFLNMMVGAGTVAGSLILSFTLRWADDYFPFLVLCAVSSLGGALLFGLTGVFRAGGHATAQRQAA
jgi:MFS family permease